MYMKEDNILDMTQILLGKITDDYMNSYSHLH